MGCNDSKEKSGPRRAAERHDVRDDVVKKPKTRELDSEKEEAKAAETQGVQSRGISLPDDSQKGDAQKSRYKQRGPTMTGEVIPCFEDGLLYRIVNGDQWGFYNDTNDYEMHVNWKFGPQSTIKPGCNDVQMNQDEAGWFETTLAIFPGETKEFISGKPNGYKSSLSAQPLTVEYKAKQAEAAEQQIRQEMEAVRALNCGRNPEEVLEACLNSGTYFVDLEFPPQTTSLSRSCDGKQLGPVAWKRPSHYLTPEEVPQVAVVKKVEPNDIDQGQLGDCWFLCSVASLAEFAPKIWDIFRHPISDEAAKWEQQHGAYRITLNKGGWWHIVITDDYFPTVGDRPCYAKNVEDPSELWVSLIEKAYAKVHGSYASIAGGDALHALQDLTGYPIRRFDEDWKRAMRNRQVAEKLFEDLLMYDQAEYLINVNTPGQDNSEYMGAKKKGNSKQFEEFYERAGLGMGHAYSVLTVKKFTQPKKLQLLKIRNPWGNGTEWTGDWGDDDPKWQQNPEIAQACDFKPGADGTFWMEWQDVLKYFDGGGCCFKKTDWHDYRIRGEFMDGQPNVVVEVTCTSPTRVFLTLSQSDRRSFPPGDPQGEYAAMMMSVFQTDPTNPKKKKIHLNTSSDINAPSADYCFNYGRDLSMTYTFGYDDKKNVNVTEPCLIVPRIYDPKGKKSFVIGIISEQPVGEHFQIRFKTLPRDATVWKDMPSFVYDPQPMNVDYQFNPEVGCPITKNGPEINIQVGEAVQQAVQEKQQSAVNAVQGGGQPQQQHVDPTPPAATEATEKTDDLPEGDWVFDEASGYYWSEEQKMFYDRPSKQFYDPESGQWYDPEKGEWYEG